VRCVNGDGCDASADLEGVCSNDTHVLAPRRIVGWCAHWRESLADPDTKIIRPQQDYRGVWLRDWQPVESRGDGSGRGDAGVEGGDTLVPLPPSNAYQRRVTGTNWQ
jgi:citrate synthase